MAAKTGSTYTYLTKYDNIEILKACRYWVFDHGDLGKVRHNNFTNDRHPELGLQLLWR